MTANWGFHGRSEPSKKEDRISIRLRRQSGGWRDESGFGKVELERNGLQSRVGYLWSIGIMTTAAGFPSNGLLVKASPTVYSRGAMLLQSRVLWRLWSVTVLRTRFLVSLFRSIPNSGLLGVWWFTAIPGLGR